MMDDDDATVRSFLNPTYYDDTPSAAPAGLLSPSTMAGLLATPAVASLPVLPVANDISYHSGASASSTSAAVPALGTITNIATAAAAAAVAAAAGSAMDDGHADPSALPLPLQSSASVLWWV
jgi:hypothetical protein